MKTNVIVGLLLGMALPVYAAASELTVTNTFTAGTPAKAAEVNQNFSDVAAAVNDNNTRITANEGALATNAAAITGNANAIADHEMRIGQNETAIADNTANIATLMAPPLIAGSVYRWNVFSTYSQQSGWYAANNGSLFGGVPPNTWSDTNALASQMSSSKDVLRALFTRKGYAGANALVYADEWVGYSSTNGKHVAALFRIKNTTATDIVWTPYVQVTAYPNWGESASIALNGIPVWSSSTTYTPTSTPISASMTIPANRTSTVIFVSGTSIPFSANGMNIRSLLLGFVNNSLALPAGLEYVDDLDVATGSWDQ